MFRNLLIAGALSLALLPPVYLMSLRSSYAEEAVCTDTYDGIVAEIRATGRPLHELTPDEIKDGLPQLEALMGKPMEGITRAFIVQMENEYWLGVEQDGCLLPPIVVGRVVPTNTLSGATPHGTYA